MIYIDCIKSADRVALSVCEKVCQGECIRYSWTKEVILDYVDVFFNEDGCPFCGDTGISGESYSCVCDAETPWKFILI